MNDVMHTRNDGHDARHEGEARLAGRADAYCKPRLRRLGAWNVFTRNGSPTETEGSGFFEFEVR